ncbi:hypothetical protein D3C72_2035420 [compost metagenome]
MGLRSAMILAKASSLNVMAEAGASAAKFDPATAERHSGASSVNCAGMRATRHPCARRVRMVALAQKR